MMRRRGVESGGSVEIKTEIKTQIIKVIEVLEGMPGRPDFDSDGFFVRTVVDEKGNKHLISEGWMKPSKKKTQVETLFGISPGNILKITSSNTLRLETGFFHLVEVVPPEKRS